MPKISQNARQAPTSANVKSKNADSCTKNCFVDFGQKAISTISIASGIFISIFIMLGKIGQSRAVIVPSRALKNVFVFDVFSLSAVWQRVKIKLSITILSKTTYSI